MLNIKILNLIIIVSLLVIAGLAIHHTYLQTNKQQVYLSPTPGLPVATISPDPGLNNHAAVPCQSLNPPFQLGSTIRYNKTVTLTTLGSPTATRDVVSLKVDSIQDSTLTISTTSSLSHSTTRYQLECYDDGIYGIPFSILDLSSTKSSTVSAQIDTGSGIPGASLLSADTLTKDFLLVPSDGLLHQGAFQRNISISIGAMPFLSTKIPLYYTVTPSDTSDSYAIAISAQSHEPSPTQGAGIPNMFGSSAVSSYLKDLAIHYIVGHTKGLENVSLSINLGSAQYKVEMTKIP